MALEPHSAIVEELYPRQQMALPQEGRLQMQLILLPSVDSRLDIEEQLRQKAQLKIEGVESNIIEISIQR